MKTRIQVIETTKNGKTTTVYIPQYKKLLFWNKFSSGYYRNGVHYFVCYDLDIAMKFLSSNIWEPIIHRKKFRIYRICDRKMENYIFYCDKNGWHAEDHILNEVLSLIDKQFPMLNTKKSFVYPRNM